MLIDVLTPRDANLKPYLIHTFTRTGMQFGSQSLHVVVRTEWMSLLTVSSQLT